MTYSPNKPLGTDFLLQSQPELLQNFAVSLQAWNANHVTFNNDDGGKHTMLTLRRQTVDPATAADEVALYSKNGVPAPAQAQLFYIPHNSATPIQMTYPSILNTGLGQYSYMAGPFIFYFGKIANATNNQIVMLTPASSTLITVLLQISSNKYTTNATNRPFAQPFAIAPTQFTILLTDIPVGSINDVYYTAIGVVV